MSNEELFFELSSKFDKEEAEEIVSKVAVHLLENEIRLLEELSKFQDRMLLKVKEDPIFRDSYDGFKLASQLYSDAYNEYINGNKDRIINLLKRK